MLICDGDVNCTQEIISRAANNNIKIYTVLIGSSTSGKAKLQNIADQTGGKFFHAQTAEEIRRALFDTQQEALEGTDTTDTDNDGLYDVYEIAGMIIPNGNHIYSDPLKADTDGDGLTDGKEMGELRSLNNAEFLLGISNAIPGFAINGELTVHYICFDYKSHPNFKDSDGDGVQDWDEPQKQALIYSNWAFVFFDYIDFTRQGNDEAKYLMNLDPEMQVRALSIDDKQEFIYYWNLYCNINADISLVFRGSPIHLWITKENLMDYEIKDLRTGNIKTLRVLSCNGGHKDVPDNIASYFNNYHEIQHLYAMDGNISYYPPVLGSLGLGNYSPRLSTSQVGFYKYSSLTGEYYINALGEYVPLKGNLLDYMRCVNEIY